MESLEKRIALTVNFSLNSNNKTLTVTGDSWNNSVTAQYSSSTSKITVTAKSTPTSGSSSPQNIVMTYAASAISFFKFYGNAGQDRLVLNFGSRTINSYAEGGSGNDYLEGSDNGKDEFWGGGDNDTLYGYGAVDKLYGGSGNDYLNGGASDDYMDGGTGLDRYKDDFTSTKWVINYDSKDVNQESSPICTIASAIASAAKSTDLSSDFKYLGNNVYQVRMVKNGDFNFQKVLFDGNWNDNDLRPSEWRDSNGVKSGQLNGEFWTLLYARAYLQLNGVNWKDTNTDNWGTAWMDHKKALYAMTGWKTSSEFISTTESTDTAKWIRTHLLTKDSMTIGGTGHAYMIADAYTVNGSWFLKLYNPWGVDGVHQSTLDYSNDGKSDGYITVSWSEVRQNFKYAYLADG